MADTERLRYLFHTLRRELSNFAVLRHRRYAGFIVSMHQSGTHWLKYMLAQAIARHWGVPPPRYNHANDIIGGPHDRCVYPQLPALASAHSLPNRMLRCGWIWSVLQLPRYVVLVRDPRAALVSNYEKWKHRYDISFGAYLEGDIAGRRFNSDIWWCIRFLNAWGALLERFPDRILLVKYEDLHRDTVPELMRLSRFLGLELDPELLSAAAAEATRERMLRRHDPARPPGEVNLERRDLHDWFGPAEQHRLRSICGKYLRFSCGYELGGDPATRA